MSDSNSSEQLGISSELLRWLRLLELPLWARIIVFAMMIVVVVGGLGMLGYAIWAQKDDIASRAMQLITLSLPIWVIVLALVFGQNSDAKLRKLTRKLLEDDFTNALRLQLPAGAHLDAEVRGCCALYRLHQAGQQALHFQLELNVYKVNVVVQSPPALDLARLEHAALQDWAHALQGAIAEGYVLNPRPGRLECGDGRRLRAFTLYRTFPKDFLLEPAQRLYFVQDLCFFMACIWHAHQSAPTVPSHTASPHLAVQAEPA